MLLLRDIEPKQLADLAGALQTGEEGEEVHSCVPLTRTNTNCTLPQAPGYDSRHIHCPHYRNGN